jgi:putative tricarboxylic transport membrane protein
VEGVIAPEAGNNACAPAAFIPLLSLGIPGSANAAIILGAFLIHGLDAGPLFMVQQTELAYTIMAGIFLSQLVMFGIPFVGVIPL